MCEEQACFVIVDLIVFGDNLILNPGCLLHAHSTNGRASSRLGRAAAVASQQSSLSTLVNVHAFYSFTTAPKLRNEQGTI